MNKRKENILAVVVFIGLITHFLFGYFFWDEIKFVNIYYVSTYFLCDVLSFTVYLIATAKWLKGIGALGMVLSVFYIYMEFQNPTYWVQRDYLTLGLVIVNCGFIWFFTDKATHKNKKI